jgi:hypothetical protein
MKPWLYPEALFAVTALKRLQTKCLDVLHNMTDSVIRTRKLDLLAKTWNKSEEQTEEHVFGNYFKFSIYCCQFRLQLWPRSSEPCAASREPYIEKEH